ncbi:leucine--tRNA ligase [Candidatus Marinamargulisbacteria bacterium SCGC AG-414-C22]|nr:leucine--tRNA ligase [Candidatus Marinamargulisbacteria bacterium SCGC AG-414-C22]
MDYKPLDFENKWLRFWSDQQIYKTEDNQSKQSYYVLEMFPYPSGALHMGHVRNYAIGDTLARFKRMNQFNVLYPMGFDSFGLPAENAAIKHNINPKSWTEDNILSMKDQLTRLGLSYDWSRELATCRDSYYRWNQWLFIQMYNKGLVYKKKGWVNWDPVDQTVLANEQVIDGKGWRSGAVVEKKEIEQWYIKITDYAEELLTDIDDKLNDWPDRVKSMQKNWIGRSEGTEIDFDIVTESGEKLTTLTVFTTRPDTLFGVTYVSIAAEHPDVKRFSSYADNAQKIEGFIQDVLNQSIIDRSDQTKAKKGEFLGVFAVNPLTEERVPLYVADYVLMEYGTGVVMAVPAHDERDFEFARNHNLSLKVVISPDGDDFSEPLTQAYTDAGILLNSASFNGVSSAIAKNDITVALGDKNKGRIKVQYKLRDWLISRQRFWGTPIPMLIDEEGVVSPVPEDQLPVTLPEKVTFTGQGNPLAKATEFCEVTINGKLYRRETDTMDTFFDSSWYFLRYCDPNNAQLPFDKELVNYWMSVDQYIGGIEHAVLHLLYARFFTKVLRDLNLVDVDEPFKRLLCQGMVLKEGAKMSKSLGNTVDPAYIINQYGADTARVFILFGAPVERDLDWSDEGVEGSFRFLKRFYKVLSEPENYALKEGKQADFLRILHKTIKHVTDDMNRFSFNTAISRLMELVNFIYQHGLLLEERLTMTKLIAPIAPFLAEQLYHEQGHTDSIHVQEWPSFDESLIEEATMTIVFQINGKVRDKCQVPKDTTKDDIESIAKSNEKLKKYFEQGAVKKVIYVPNKLVNFVVV